MPKQELSNIDLLEVSLDRAILCHISQTKAGHNVKDWVEYLENAEIGIGLDIEIMNEYLKSHGADLIGESLEA